VIITPNPFGDDDFATPMYDDHKVNSIYKGDVLETLKTFGNDVIDLSITSPPYNKLGKGGQVVPKIKYDTFDDNLPEDDYQKQQIEVLKEIYRITKPGGSIFYNHRCRWVNGVMIHPMEWLDKTDWKPRQEIIWDRSITGQLRSWRFYTIDERIYWLYKPKNNITTGEEMKSKHAKMSTIWRISPERNNEHPAPFPLEIPLRIILSILDEEKGLVLDPYMGSGTTAVAAKLLGSDYVGIDISEKYIKDAQDRIDNFETERNILIEEKRLHQLSGKTYLERMRAKQIRENDFWEVK
jgi:modification methylase